jgi:transposase InsO family protein
MRYQFIQAHQALFPVQRTCRLMNVSSSGFYAWRKRLVSAREMANQALVGQIRAAHATSRGSYGSPRIHRELKAQGIACGLNRVARLMRRHQIHGRPMRRYRVTTRAKKAHAVAANLLAGHFAAERPNEKWLADLSYIRTVEGWLYLAVILDLFSRRVVGWAMEARLTSPLTERALKMAISRRQPAPGLVHHSDRGRQYTGQSYQQLLRQNKMLVSMSGAGNCYDNAPVESFFASLKSERVHQRRYRSREEARSDVFYYIEAFYNRRRRHSALGYLSPVDFERLYAPLQPSALTLCP